MRGLVVLGDRGDRAVIGGLCGGENCSMAWGWIFRSRVESVVVSLLEGTLALGRQSDDCGKLGNAVKCNVRRESRMLLVSLEFWSLVDHPAGF